MTKTIATMFTGGGLFDVGAQAAGYETVWGVEWDDRIAAVARANGLPVMTADATRVDYSQLRRPNHLHASPPCPNFSIAKANAEETPFDLEMSHSVCRAIAQLQPDSFSLENVVPYRTSLSLATILRTLGEHGYFYDVQSLNAADYGIPQTRNRLFVRASKRLLMSYPPAQKWQGWYQAIADLIPSLPETKFAPWQIERLPSEYLSFMIGQGTRSEPRGIDEPAQTITSNNNQSAIKAFVISGGNTSFADAKPGKGVRFEDEPICTLNATSGGGAPRAFLVSGSNSNSETFTVRQQQQQPHYTITASIDRCPSRAFVHGRVVKMTIQALGRFQTVPDHYVGLTTKINGNGVPCKLAEMVMRSFGA